MDETILLAFAVVVANVAVVLWLRRSLDTPSSFTTDALVALNTEVSRYRELAEGTLAALTRRAEEGDRFAGQLQNTQDAIGRSLERFSEVLNEHLIRHDGSGRLVRALEEEVRYLRRIAFADNEYIKAVENPQAQGSVAAQVRRESEPPQERGRAPVRPVRFRPDEDEFPPPRARARTINLDDPGSYSPTEPAVNAAEPNPWGAEPGRVPTEARFEGVAVERGEIVIAPNGGRLTGDKPACTCGDLPSAKAVDPDGPQNLGPVCPIHPPFGAVVVVAD